MRENMNSRFMSRMIRFSLGRIAGILNRKMPAQQPHGILWQSNPVHIYPYLWANLRHRFAGQYRVLFVGKPLYIYICININAFQTYCDMYR